MKKYSREYYNKILNKYLKTKKGFIHNLYNNQVKNSIKRNHQPPTYTKEELKEWIYSQVNFKDLYYNWVENRHDKKLTPSIDRLDDYKGYSLDNIQLVTWKENNDKYHSDRKKGINNKQNKSVSKHDVNGNLLQEYFSIAEACRNNNGVYKSNIYQCCNNKRKTAGGFKWKYN